MHERAQIAPSLAWISYFPTIFSVDRWGQWHSWPYSKAGLFPFLHQILSRWKKGSGHLLTNKMSRPLLSRDKQHQSTEPRPTLIKICLGKMILRYVHTVVLKMFLRNLWSSLDFLRVLWSSRYWPFSSILAIYKRGHFAANERVQAGKECTWGST